jgi:CRP/FNR family transcriptional regulator, cyclic AMP receptor protein
MKQLSLIEKAFFLKKTKVFSDLDLDLLLAIADKISQDLYDKDETVFSINQVANRMYFVANGTVQILDQGDQMIAELSPPEFFGDEALFNEKPRTFHAICKTEALLLTLSRSNLMTILSECPSVATSFLQCYSNPLTCRQKIPQ